MIETDRLILRHWREDDAEDLYKYASDERVSRLALWPAHTSVDMSLEVIKSVFIPNRDTFAITERITGEAVGCIGLVPEGMENYPPADGEREAGYWIGYPLWNKGLTSEALKAFIGYCRDTLHIKSLLITTDSLNIASQRVAAKCGFIHIADYDHEGTPSKAFRLSLD